MGTADLFCFILSKHNFVLTKGLCCNTDTSIVVILIVILIVILVILIEGVFESCFLMCMCVCMCVCVLMDMCAYQLPSIASY